MVENKIEYHQIYYSGSTIDGEYMYFAFREIFGKQFMTLSPNTIFNMESRNA